MEIDELKKGPEQLKTEVIGSGWCVSCGACVEMCPYIKAVGDRVAVTHPCNLSDGNCYIVCPRTFTDYEYLAGVIFGSKPDPALGFYRQIMHARSTTGEFSSAGQYGGVVSALTALVLEESNVDAALLTASDGLYPHPVLAQSKEDVIEAAGSKYGVCPGLSGLNRAMGLENLRLAVVGRPCQVTALRKMQYHSTVEGRDNIRLLLGLFCFWALDYRFYDELREKHGATNIFRADIPKDSGVYLETDQGKIAFTLEETRSYARKGCHSCADPTSELADLSIGSTEGDSSWCTILIRTSFGETLVNKAIRKGLLEIREYPEAAFNSLYSAAATKKRRVLEASADDLNNSYLKVSGEIKNRLTGEGA